jgi:hypothetical protein
MLISQKQDITDLIVETLATDPYQSGPVLVSSIQALRPKTTKQAVYTALKELLRSEIVAKVGSQYFLSRVWLQKMQQLFSQQTTQELQNDAIFHLRDGESISYRFPSLMASDVYWAHVFDLLTDWIPKERPIIVWNPHEWFVLGRTHVEQSVFRQFQLKKKYALYAIQGTTALDRAFKKDWVNSHVSIHVGDDNNFPTHYYVNVFDDFILEVFVDKQVAAAIEDFYENTKTLSAAKITEFESLITKNYPVRMKLSRNKKKALVLRKKIAKNFYLPKETTIE